MVVEALAQVKQCTRCGEVKSLNSFYEHRKGGLGVRSLCKSCWQEYKKAHPHWNRKARTNWRLANPERTKCERRFNYYFTEVSKMVRPLLCRVCGKPAKTQAHHPDLAKPFEVCWCCQFCHQKIERGEIAISPLMITTYPF